MTYKFPNFQAEITDPTVTVQTVTDNIAGKTCTVSILLETAMAKFGVSLDGFSYEITWEDADIESWVAVKLKEYEQ